MNPAPSHYPLPVRRAAVLIAILMAGGIAYFSLIPGGTVPGPYFEDKIRHFGAYAALAVPVAIRIGPGRLGTVLLLTVYGAGIEVAQGLLSATREPSFADGIANLLGASLGYALVWFMARIRRA